MTDKEKFDAAISFLMSPEQTKLRIERQKQAYNSFVGRMNRIFSQLSKQDLNWLMKNFKL